MRKNSFTPSLSTNTFLDHDNFLLRNERLLYTNIMCEDILNKGYELCFFDQTSSIDTGNKFKLKSKSAKNCY